MKEVMVSLMSMIVGAFVSYFTLNRNLSDSLDTKSGWRQKLFEVASTYELTLDHAQTVRAALRFLPPHNEKVEEYSFAWFSNIMIMHLDKCILNKEYQLEQKEVCKTSKKTDVFHIPLLNTEELKEKKISPLTDFDTKIVRHFAMFLLKYHYENRNSMGPKNYLFIADKNKNTRYNPIVVEAYCEYIKLIKEGIQNVK